MDNNKDQFYGVTHWGPAHADEAFGMAMLKIVHPGIVVIRTRDPAQLAAAIAAPNTYLLDVGGRYDPKALLFDHHQPEGAGFRKPETAEWPYATAGLIWKHCGDLVVKKLHPDLDEVGVADVVKHIDDSVIRYVDAVDCGYKVKTAGPSLSGIIASFNPSWYESAEENVFPLILSLAEAILTNLIKRHAGKVLARDRVRKLAPCQNGRVLLLEACMPWSDVVSNEMPDVLFVIYPAGAQWQLRATVNLDMTPRTKLPASWAGYERAALSRITSEPLAVFCHRSRHLAGATTKDAAMALALKSLAIHDEAMAQAAVH